MDNDQALIDALAAAGVAVSNGMAVADLYAACRAYHKAMIVATPGLCVQEPDGTVRAATDADWSEIEHLRQQVAEAGFALEDACHDRDRFAALYG